MTAPFVTPSRDQLAEAIRKDFHARECVYLDFDGDGCACDERADALLASGVVRAADTLPDDEALAERVAEAVIECRDAYPRVPNDADSHHVTFVALTALATALESR